MSTLSPFISPQSLQPLAGPGHRAWLALAGEVSAHSWSQQALLRKHQSPGSNMRRNPGQGWALNRVEVLTLVVLSFTGTKLCNGQLPRVQCLPAKKCPFVYFLYPPAYSLILPTIFLKYTKTVLGDFPK